MSVAVIDNGSAVLGDLKVAVHSALQIEPAVINYPSISVEGFDMLIFSGRAKKSSQIDSWMHKLLERSGDVPSVFICYAAEFLNLSKGGTLRKLERHLYGLYDVIFESSTIGIPEGNHSVFESRSLSIGRLGKGLEPFAYGNGVEAFISDRGQLGVMFHPEKSGDFGLKLIRSYFMGKYF